MAPRTGGEVERYVDNRYQILDRLGAGPFGQVLKVLDTHQGSEVALKILDPAKLSGPWPWHEPTRLMYLRSDHILRVRGAGQTYGFPYIVSELADGDPLDAVCGDLGLAPASAIRAVREAARGIQCAHDALILHRDIKLENLFAGPGGRTVVGDLGLAHPMRSDGTAPRGGTLFTMAPETLGPPRETSVATEVYALGACLYRLLTGVYPFMDGAVSEADLARLIQTASPTAVRELAPNVPSALAAHVKKALARDPKERHGTAAAFDAALGELPAPTRSWRAVTPIGAVTREWVGERLGRATVHVVVHPDGEGRRLDVYREPGGRRSRAHCRRVTLHELPRAVRVAMAAHP